MLLLESSPLLLYIRDFAPRLLSELVNLEFRDLVPLLLSDLPEDRLEWCEMLSSTFDSRR